MKRKIVYIATGAMLAIGTAVFFSGGLFTPKVDAEAKGKVSYTNKATQEGVFQDVNTYRSKFGRPALQRHEGLDKLAQRHSEFLRDNRGKFKLSKTGNVSHFGFEGRSAIARNQYGITELSENVAAGPRGTSLVLLWAGSTAHEKTMRGKFKYTGIGIAKDTDGFMFVTQLFGSPGLPQMSLRQTFGGW